MANVVGPLLMQMRCVVNANVVGSSLTYNANVMRWECSKSLTFLFTLLSTILYSSSAAHAVYNVVELGAKPNGQNDSTYAFIQAWTMACGSVRPSMIYVPPGMYLLNHITFNGKACKNSDITIRIDGSLIAPSDYRVLGNVDKWLAFQDVNGVSIHGGIIDGRGSGLWNCKASGHNCPDGARSLTFTKSKNILITGLKSINSQMFHVAINGCENVKLQGVNIIAPGSSPNTDGIHVQSSTGVTIINVVIKTGDDCISIGPGAKNLWIEKISCGPGHGISIGSLAKDAYEEGVANVTVKNVIFTNTQNGLRIKAWGRPSNGFVNGVLFQHAVMRNVQNPIVIDQNYCPRNEGCPNLVSGIKISRVTYQDIQGTSATQLAVKFSCSSMNPCQGIRLEDVKLTYRNQSAQSSCLHANGSTFGFVVPTSCL